MKIVFMGTPDFAVPSLEKLISTDGYEVVGVFTQPDKPKGRGYTLTPPPVKVCATEHGIPVYQPESVKNGEAIPILEELQPDVIVVAAFGMLLKSDILDFPKYGCMNVHGSILPKYRGAAPIQRAVIDGEEYSGITIMQMGVGLDTGDMLVKREVKIEENETSGELFDRLAILGADVLIEALELAQKGELKPEKQDDEKSTYAAMLSKAECPVDFTKSSQEIHNKIRGLSPWPVATANLNGEVFKLHASQKTGRTAPNGAQPGKLIAEKDALYVVCGDGKLLNLTVVQPFGSKRMPAADYLRGHKITEESVLN